MIAVKKRMKVRPRMASYRQKFEEIMTMRAIAIATPQGTDTLLALIGAGSLGLSAIGTAPVRSATRRGEERLSERRGRLGIVGSDTMVTGRHRGAH